MTAQSLKLEGRVAIVTGAARGIGRSIVIKLASEGAQVVANDLDAAPLVEGVGKLAQQGLAVHALPGDITEQATAEALVSTALDRYGNLHIVVNNAGYIWNSAAIKHTDEQWHAMLDVHATGPFRAKPGTTSASRRVSIHRTGYARLSTFHRFRVSTVQQHSWLIPAQRLRLLA